MKQRIDYRKTAPDAFAAMLRLESYARECGLPKSLLELVKMRASQINGCAYCLNGWNRLAISFRAPAGSYQPAKK